MLPVSFFIAALESNVNPITETGERRQCVVVSVVTYHEQQLLGTSVSDGT